MSEFFRNSTEPEIVYIPKIKVLSVGEVLREAKRKLPEVMKKIEEEKPLNDEEILIKMAFGKKDTNGTELS